MTLNQRSASEAYKQTATHSSKEQFVRTSTSFCDDTPLPDQFLTTPSYSIVLSPHLVASPDVKLASSQEWPTP